MTDGDFEETFKSEGGVMALFFEDRRPFSRGFLSVCEKSAATGGPACARVLFDGDDELFEQYPVDVYPGVIFCKSGGISKRLDGTPFAGLNEKPSTALMKWCVFQ